MKFGHALVLGGSVAGLMAAGAARDYFDRVTIIERDDLPDQPVFRAGAPQGTQIHVILALGLEAAEEIFPGLHEEWIAHGCEVFDEAAGVPRLSAAGWRLRVHGTAGIGFRRPLLEWVVRQRLLRSAHVSIERGSVNGLVLSEDRSSVVGVTLRDGRELRGDFVINATGRRSGAMQWLAELGVTKPVERIANAKMGYATQFVRVPDGTFRDGVVGLDVVPWPGCHRGGALLPADNGVHSLTAIGIARDYPPRDREGFLAFLDDAPTPLLGQIARTCEPVSEINVYHQDGNLRRLWEEVPDLPERFLVVGDSMASFNPVFGQGMSLAAGSAAFLREVLSNASELDGVARDAQQRAGALADAGFSMTASYDKTFDGALLTPDVALATPAELNRARALDELATEDAEVAGALSHAAYHIDPAVLDSEWISDRVDRWLASGRRPAEFDPSVYPGIVHSIDQYAR